MRGNLDEILMMIDPEIYHKYITANKKGGYMIYVKAINSLYVIMRAEILFYNTFVGDLTYIGLKLKTFDLCSTKSSINGNQIAVVWHIYNLKVNHDSKEIFTSMGKWLKETYDRLFED